MKETIPAPVHLVLARLFVVSSVCAERAIPAQSVPRSTSIVSVDYIPSIPSL